MLRGGDPSGDRPLIPTILFLILSRWSSSCWRSTRVRHLLLITSLDQLDAFAATEHLKMTGVLDPY